MQTRPSYLQLQEQGLLTERTKLAAEILRDCRLCPHDCRINRAEEEKGFCRAGHEVVVSSAGPHFGEERVLSGGRGSGTIFFSHCNLRCTFCQNYELSHLAEGWELGLDSLVALMLRLQQQGCNNINFVSPTHFAAQIVQAVGLGAQQGLRLPLVYNSGGFDSLETLSLLDGIIDIYMPDLKFWEEDIARKYTGAQGYPEAVKTAVKEMHRQVGDLKTNERGLAYRGLLVRHLVMPAGLAGTEQAMKFLAQEISPSTYVNIMGQYYPEHKAQHDPLINRATTRRELLEAVSMAREAGLKRVIY